jgi:hypothetical protein
MDGTAQTSSTLCELELGDELRGQTHGTVRFIGQFRQSLFFGGVQLTMSCDDVHVIGTTIPVLCGRFRGSPISVTVLGFLGIIP